MSSCHVSSLPYFKTCFLWPQLCLMRRYRMHRMRAWGSSRSTCGISPARERSRATPSWLKEVRTNVSPWTLCATGETDAYNVCCRKDLLIATRGSASLQAMLFRCMPLRSRRPSVMVWRNNMTHHRHKPVNTSRTGAADMVWAVVARTGGPAGRLRGGSYSALSRHRGGGGGK